MTGRARLASVRKIAAKISAVGDRARFAYSQFRALGLATTNRARFVFSTSRAVLAYQIEVFRGAIEPLFSSLTESQQASDSQFVEISKNIIDVVSATDDVDGLASVLDDQQIQFFKVIRESIQSSETIAPVLDGIRGPSESPSLDDTPRINLTKVISEQLTVSELFVFGRAFEEGDSAGFSESSVFAIGKGLSDSGLFSESVSVNYDKLLIDQAGIEDSPRMSLAKLLNESGIATDVLVKSASKGLSDSPLVGDSGSVTIQDYCDPSYFAQDYVGDSRTFT